MVNYHNQSDSLEKFFLPGIETTFHRARALGAKFPFIFKFVEETDRIKYEVEYNTHFFTTEQIEHVKTVLHTVLKDLCNLQAPSELVSKL